MDVPVYQFSRTFVLTSLFREQNKCSLMAEGVLKIPSLILKLCINNLSRDLSVLM